MGFGGTLIAYGKAIKFDVEKHKEIIELVEWAKEVNILNYGINLVPLYSNIQLKTL